MKRKIQRRIVIFSGAGVSAESGLNTFRDPQGIWAQYRIEEVATPEAWERDPERVLDFYNQRRRQLLQVAPNAAHRALAALEEYFEEVHIITQNIDDLHEQAGSTRVLHLHGELRKVRSVKCPGCIYPWDGDLHLGNCCEHGYQLRPHVVWFGEDVPLFPRAVDLVKRADAFAIVGTSLQVYPAASLAYWVPEAIPHYYVDPRPNLPIDLHRTVTVVEKTATEGVPWMVDALIRHFQ